MALAKFRIAAAAAALCGALGAQAHNPELPAELLFWSGFEGPLKLLAPSDCYRRGCFQELIGTDSRTGFQWPFSVLGGESKFQLLVDGPRPTPETVGEYMSNELRTVKGPHGRPTRALYSEVRQSGCCGPLPQGGRATQNVLHVFPGGEPGDLYFSKWLKLQPDLVDKLHAGGGWRVVFEWKEGGYRGKGGAFRTILLITAANGRPPSWQVKWDNDANGGDAKQEFWRRQNASVPVPVGEWFKLETFWHRSRGADGRIWYAVNGKVIDDHYGPTIGVRNDPVGRIMINQVYSGSPYPIYQWSDDVQIWKGFPKARPADPWYDPPYAPH
jgi:hypothetical protein